MASEPDVWVVGSDGSECAWHAAQWAAEHASGRAEHILIASAWNEPPLPPITPMGSTAVGWDVDQVRSAARVSVDDVAQRMRHAIAQSAQPETVVEAALVEGTASSVLLDAARDAALMVLGSRGLGGFSRLVLGSTSTQCATHAERPTVIVPHSASVSHAHRIVVAFDGSDNAMTALRWAIDFADDGAVVDCIMVWDVTPIVVGSDQFFFPEASDLARARFDYLVDQIVDEASSHTNRSRSAITRRFVEGRPRTELAKNARDADLLVMGARGHGAIGAALLGSVSTWLLHHVDRAMVVVPADPSPAKDRA